MSLLEPQIATISFAADLARHGERPALVAADGLVSYAALDRRVTELVHDLGPVRRLVAFEAVPKVESVAAYLAGLRAGHVVLPLAPGGGAAVDRLLEVYDPDVLITAGTDWAVGERRPASGHALHPELALLLSTSGSTGAAKLVRLGAEGVQANASAIGDYLGLTSSDRAVTTLPLHYCYGLSVLNSHLSAGASVVLNDLSVVDPCFWRRFVDVGATNLSGVPYTFDLLDRVGFDAMDLPDLRFVTQAGGRLAPDVVHRYAELGRRRGWDLFVMYGQTEATARMAYLPPPLASSHPHAIGIAIPGGALDIDPVGEDPDEGELVYRGPNVMLGYAATATDLAAGREVEALRTGDLARRGAGGVFEIVGRRSRFIKPFGIRVDLDHLEADLARAGIPALCAGDDARLAVVAVADAAATAAAVAARTGLPQRCMSVVSADELPRLANGKPDHAAVLASTTPQAPPAVRDPDRDGVDGLRDAFALVLGGPVAPEDSFVTAGGDSLSYVELSIRLEELLGELPADWHLRPVRDLEGRRPGARRWHRVETTIVLRAVAIVLIVGSHARAWHVVGGAHLLLAIAGTNFARFQRTAAGAWRSARRVAVPCVCWLAGVAALSDEFSWTHALLLNSLVGPPGSRWAYWFVEALTQTLLVAAALLALPPLGRAERRAPFAAALAITAVTMVLRFDLVQIGARDHHTSRAPEIVWLFALGWLGAVADTRRRRILVSALVVGSVAGFFGDPAREALIAIGTLAAMWLPAIPVPAPLHRVAGRVASASLWIYLCHWQIYPPVSRLAGPVASVVVSVLGGVVAWRAYGRVERRVQRIAGERRARRPARAAGAAAG